ncbi:uncharacterized protein LOC121985506 [Zingiber officinale]|uniref:uncharacterized protein LOC121985506 n=1 Tax=Zingiber officinale TaxID=94328 RepID=UPI001C4C66A5|nr:uncharacterized protein LOC121985506 [Zingiber officinale]
MRFQFCIQPPDQLAFGTESSTVTFPSISRLLLIKKTWSLKFALSGKAQKLINARSDMLLDSVSPVLFQAALHVREKKLAKAKEVFISMQTYSRTNPNWSFLFVARLLSDIQNIFNHSGSCKFQAQSWAKRRGLSVI